jgi:hypothetical protein
MSDPIREFIERRVQILKQIIEKRKKDAREALAKAFQPIHKLLEKLAKSTSPGCDEELKRSIENFGTAQKSLLGKCVAGFKIDYDKWRKMTDTGRLNLGKEQKKEEEEKKGDRKWELGVGLDRNWVKDEINKSLPGGIQLNLGDMLPKEYKFKGKDIPFITDDGYLGGQFTIVQLDAYMHIWKEKKKRTPSQQRLDDEAKKDHEAQERRDLDHDGCKEWLDRQCRAFNLRLEAVKRLENLAKRSVSAGDLARFESAKEAAELPSNLPTLKEVDDNYNERGQRDPALKRIRDQIADKIKEIEATLKRVQNTKMDFKKLASALKVPNAADKLEAALKLQGGARKKTLEDLQADSKVKFPGNTMNALMKAH